MSTATMLRILFDGWCTIRMPTDPDPTDEPRGASGYTFAFAGEPDLDRLVRLQPEREPALIRPGAPWSRWGVFVRDARIAHRDGSMQTATELVGASVQLVGEPRLENRNWVLTPPGYEPIVPFDLQFERGGRTVLRRSAPLDDQPGAFWQKPRDTLMAQGAVGVGIEPVLIRQSTGLPDATTKWRQRVDYLEAALAAEPDPVSRVRLRARLLEVHYALEHPNDRRSVTHHAVERFAFDMTGDDAVVDRSGELVTLDDQAPWAIRFWIGCFDCDLLAAFFQGTLEVPFKSASPTPPVG